MNIYSLLAVILGGATAYIICNEPTDKPKQKIVEIGSDGEKQKHEKKKKNKKEEKDNSEKKEKDVLIIEGEKEEK